MLCPRKLWPAFIRVLIVALVGMLALALFLARNPGARRDLVLLFPIPGVADIPPAGPTPPPPVIHAPRGELPGGTLAFTGITQGRVISCGFLLDLEDGRRVGVSAAHATPRQLPGIPAEFRFADETTAAVLTSQIAHGRVFYQDHFNMDYAVWTVAEDAARSSPKTALAQRFLKPDPRGQGQPGESILVLRKGVKDERGSNGWPGVITRVTPEASWIQLADSFDPRGYSGCPVISQYTGRLIGMAVAGANQHPVVMGLHPAGSLVEKARMALQNIKK